jgi:hypothetical protein
VLHVEPAHRIDRLPPPSFADGALWLMLPSGFHQSQILKGENFRVLTQRIEKLTNTSVVLKTRIADAGEVKAPREASFDAIADRHPIVKALVRDLGGKVVDVRRPRQRPPSGERPSQGGETG